MKKILTLVLCWLLAFSAIAETTFKAKTAASVAGGYVTSLNKVDGSFEDGSTQWSASVGTIVPTASTEFQGNKYGLWSGTGTGTLDLQWTATASNTYEASAQVDVQGEDDVYVCAYVGTTETGCKLIPAFSKIQKVSVVADSVMSSAFYLRLKHTGSDAFNVKVDDGKIEPWTPQVIGTATSSVVQTWQPSDFLGEIKLLPSTTAPKGFIPADGKSIGKTSGNYQGDAYYALYALRWAMASTTAGEPYVISSAKGASAQADWDAGKTITIDVRGMFFRAAGGNAGAVGSKQLDAFQGHEHRIGYYTGAGTRTDSFVQANDLASWSTNSNLQNGYNDDGTNGTPRTASETRPINTSEYAYMRYGTSAPDLIALPTSKENRCEITVENSGTPVLSSKNYDCINNVSLNGIGHVVINYAKMGLTAPPSVVANSVGGSSVRIVSVSTTSVELSTLNGSSDANLPIHVKISKQSPDYTAPGVFVGSLAKDYTAYVDASEAITNATDNFITSCTNADPTVCTFATNKFGTPPYCNAQKTSSADVYVTTTSTTSVTIERADASSPFSLFCQIK